MFRARLEEGRSGETIGVVRRGKRGKEVWRKSGKCSVLGSVGAPHRRAEVLVDCRIERSSVSSRDREELVRRHAQSAGHRTSSFLPALRGEDSSVAAMIEMEEPAKRLVKRPGDVEFE